MYREQNKGKWIDLNNLNEETNEYMKLMNKWMKENVLKFN